IDAGQAEWEEAQIPSDDGEEKKGSLPAKITAIVALDPEERTAAQQTELRDYYRKNVSAEGKKLYQKAAQLSKSRDEIQKAIPTTMVMADMEKPRDTFFLVRGQYDKKGDKVRAGVPAFFPSPPANAVGNRLGLAQWLVSREQ